MYFYADILKHHINSEQKWLVFLEEMWFIVWVQVSSQNLLNGFRLHPAFGGFLHLTL